MGKSKKEAIRQNVGIDVSKAKLSVCFYELNSDQKTRIRGNKTFANSPKGYESLLVWLTKWHKKELRLSFTVEATGVYHENLVYYLHEKGYKVSVLLANKVKAYQKSFNIKTKTDKMDAKLLGLMGLERQLEEWYAPSKSIRALKQLTRERVSILEERTMLGNKLEALQNAFEANERSMARLKVRLELYNEQLKEVEQAIQEFIKADEDLSEKVKKICTIKGLGNISVATIIAETDGFGLFSSRSQLVSYAGYDIVERQSGSSINGKSRISKKGNRFIRRVLHFPAISAARHEPVFKKLYDRVYERNKIKMKALVAVQRKLLVFIYTLYKKNEAFDPYFELKKKEKQSRQDKAPAYTG